MATITPTTVYTDRQVTWVWTGAATGDTIVAAEIKHNPSDLILYVSGTFGSATVTFTGSIDDTNYATGLVDITGTAVSITAAGGGTLRDAWRYIKPAIAGGTGDSLTIKLMARIAS